MRHYAGTVSPTDDSTTLRGGTRLAPAEDVIRARGRELRLMPTSYKKSQIAGFVAGGSGGLGSITTECSRGRDTRSDSTSIVEFPGVRQIPYFRTVRPDLAPDTSPCVRAP